MNKEKRTNVVQLLENFCTKTGRGQLKGLVDSFKANSDLYLMKKKYLTKILQAGCGKAMLIFSIWKTLPKPPDDYRIKLANRFERGLGSFVNKTIKETLKQFEDIGSDGEARKKKCIIKLMKITMS